MYYFLKIKIFYRLMSNKRFVQINFFNIVKIHLLNLEFLLFFRMNLKIRNNLNQILYT